MINGQVRQNAYVLWGMRGNVAFNHRIHEEKSARQYGKRQRWCFIAEMAVRAHMFYGEEGTQQYFSRQREGTKVQMRHNVYN